MEKRVLLAVVLSFLVLLFYSAYFSPSQKPQPQWIGEEGERTEAPLPSEDISRDFEEETLPATPSVPAVFSVPEKEVRVETPLYFAVFSTRGAAL